MNTQTSGKKRWQWLVALSLLALTTIPPPTHAVGFQDDHANSSKHDDDDDKKSATPPGLFITPTALANAAQQLLNPGLPNYPNFVTGEAVKAVVSPDGKTLAILTAGMNSLINSTGTAVDTAASTQFLFLYDIAGANKTKPVLKQVIQQLNAHVGLVWAPNSQTLYAAGGCDDAVYTYGNNGGSFVQSTRIKLQSSLQRTFKNGALLPELHLVARNRRWFNGQWRRRFSNTRDCRLFGLRSRQRDF